jgi:hypothetical protein
MNKQLKIFVFLNLLDFILTYYALEYVISNMYESNPIYSYTFNLFGVFIGLFIIKVLGIIILINIFNSFYKEYKSIMNKTIIFINIIYIIIVLNNIYQIYQTFK